jgi:hypothetical protein
VEKFETKFYSPDGLGFGRFLHILNHRNNQKNLEGSMKMMYGEKHVPKKCYITKELQKFSMNHEELYVKIVRGNWDTNIKRVDALLSALSDAQLEEEIAPGKNRGIYLLGHLTAVHDGLFDILGLGKRLYPQLDAVYLSSPDKAGLEMVPTPTLRQQWSEVNGQLAAQFSRMQPSDWFTQHMNMSPDDFIKEPHRNKLSVLLTRIGHLAYHHGQLVLLKK